MGSSVAGAWPGEGRCVDVGFLKYHSVPGGAPLLVRAVVHVPEDWEGAGRISPSVDMAADGADVTS